MIKPQVTIERATIEDIVRWYGPIEFTAQWSAKVIKKGSLVVAFAGIIEIESGVWFAFFEVPKQHRKPILLRHIREIVDDVIQKGAKVIKAYCDHDIPRSEALMKHLGFVETKELLGEKVIWQWEC